MQEKQNTIERLIPDMLNPDDITGKATLDLHLQRYEFAAKYVNPGRLLDIACGVGYGTRLLADKRGEIVEVIGVDISQEAIEYASQHYATQKICFKKHDAMTFTDEKAFDSIVSLETIEHMPEPDLLIQHLHALLRPGGIFIASVPTTPSVDINPYHYHDFSENSIRDMVTRHGFKEIASLVQVQPYPVIKVLTRTESRMKDMRSDLTGYYIKHPAAIYKRLLSTIRYGFSNRYLTVAWLKV